MQLDPRTKLMIFVCLIVLSMGGSIISFSAAAVMVTAVASVEPHGYVRIFRKIKYFLWMLPLTFLFHLVFALQIFGGSGSPFSGESVENALFFTVRVFLLILSGGYFLASIEAGDLIESLRNSSSILRKLKLPLDSLGMIFMLTISFAPILSEQASRIREAQSARGINGGKRLMERVRLLLPIITPMLVLSLARAERLGFALEARGYNFGGERTHIRRFRFGSTDYLVMAGAIAAMFLSTG